MNKYRVYILVVAAVLLAFFYWYFVSGVPVKSELSQIQKISKDYKEKNGNFGVLSSTHKKGNCFDGNTFVKVPEMNEVLVSPNVENISCIFKTASGTLFVESWSITIVKGEKAFCEDSTGDRRETPGLTTQEVCNIPN